MCDPAGEQASPPGSTDPKNEALQTLALWSHPAWLSESAEPSMSTVAAREWVAHHRISVASRQVTVVEVIGSVRGVIPRSRLSTYGDYSYDIDYEDMCGVPESDVSHRTGEVDLLHPDKRRDLVSSTETHPQVHRKREPKNLLECNKKRSLRDWLGRLDHALERVRRIGYDEALLQDPQADAMLKTCQLFLRTAALNDTLIKLMRSEVYFIVDYKEIWLQPISRTELLSIPQPAHAEVLDPGQADVLWTKLSSPQVRKLWRSNDSGETFPGDSSCSHLMETNYLRCKRRKELESPENIQHIPKQTEQDLLGSLLDVINETSAQSDLPCTDSVHSSNALSSLFGKVEENKPRSCLFFSDTRGEWMELLSAHCPRKSVQRESRRRSQMQQPRPTSSGPTTGENLPQIPFYKSLPPQTPAPTLSASVRPPLHTYCHRRRMPEAAGNATKALQLQLKAPVPSISKPPNFNWSLPLRLTTPVQVVDTSRVLLEPMRMSYPIKSYRLQTPVIQPNFALRSQHPLPQTLGFKPRFLGAITMDDIKRAQERQFYQKCKLNGTTVSSNEGHISVPPDSISCEDKVGRWLQSVNQYANSGSFVDINKLLCAPTEFEILCGSHPDEKDRAEYKKSLDIIQISCAYEDMKGAFQTFVHEKPHAGANLKLSKSSLGKLLTKHLLLLKRAPFKCKKGKDSESKIKLAKTYIMEMSFACNNNKMRRAANRFLRNHQSAKRMSQSNKNRARIKPKVPLRIPLASLTNRLSSSEVHFNIQEGGSLLNASDFKTLVRETHEFNALPSKRRKLGNIPFLEREAEVSGKMACLKQYESIIDELLFSQVEHIEEFGEENSETLNGWTHFKVVVKTLMDHIVSALGTAEKSNH